MRHALGLARRGLGRTAPNPAVGCVLVKDGIIIARGHTMPGGRPHAERVALDAAGSLARGATAYVTLEPCAHTGKTGPCADALVAAGVARVVVAVTDPDPRVAGGGNAKLRAAGIEVTEGVLSAEATALNQGFFLKVTENRPLFTLKLASSLDGRIALGNGASKWITGPEARHYGHWLRANHDAILMGINTVLADNPTLDCRLPGLSARSPVRVVLDRQLRTPTDSNIVATACEIPTWIITSQAAMDRADAYEDWGVELIALEDPSDLGAVAAALADRELTRVLVEGGGQVHASFLKAGLVDRVEHFSAPKLIGGDGVPAIGPLALASLGAAPHLRLKHIRRLGADILASYEKAE
ncbi:MAG: bifunctional diaminohydroxyphosphoribosylaminopyrimidine deaminase/5-amino-6-(5-phosphoribosylamino)uracil reductase RibD [Alphaproteobacteria bacterium]|nr:MAG: bifunctional diaminohydroxyphosphoribosylaminopyrimidine deaminase/5-amino-6-(5-phosphoribosylamino)uracil reductase RibD [Alphaproteobacteria bacterium]